MIFKSQKSWNMDVKSICSNDQSDFEYIFILESWGFSSNPTYLNLVLNSNHKITSAWLRNIQDEEVDDDRGRKFYYFIFEILAREPILYIIFLMAFYIEKIFFLWQEHALESPTAWTTTVEPGTWVRNQPVYSSWWNPTIPGYWV